MEVCHLGRSTSPAVSTVTSFSGSGCGFNVSNSNPTVCINDLIQQHNRQNNGRLQPLSCSQLIGRTVSCLEGLINSFQRGGPDAVLPTYYKRWLHR